MGDEWLRLRPTWWGALQHELPRAGNTLVGTFLARLVVHRQDLVESTVGMGAFLAVLMLCAAGLYRARAFVELEGNWMSHRRIFVTRVTWADAMPAPTVGARGVRISPRGERRRVLPTPLGGFGGLDAAGRAQAALISTWWHTQRGVDETVTPPPADRAAVTRSASPYRRPGARSR